MIFDALDNHFDFAVLVVVMLLTVIAAQAWMIRTAWQEIAAWRRRAERAETLLMLSDRESDREEELKTLWRSQTPPERGGGWLR